MGTPWELDGNTVVTHWEWTQKKIKIKIPTFPPPNPEKKNPKEKEKEVPLEPSCRLHEISIFKIVCHHFQLGE
jgi:hypothetical protein